MKPLKRIRYWTMNSWNRCASLAYNLKIYNVIDKDLQRKAYEMLAVDSFYDDINELVREFNWYSNYEWTAGFNGRSNGYLVLYKKGQNHIKDDEVPTHIKRAFRKLALDIVKHTEYLAKHYVVAEEEIIKIEKIKVLKEAS